jgi:two-component SAPR family response regulator
MLLYLAAAPSSFGQEGLKSGLRFSSHEVIKDQRTSLNLSPHQPFTFNEGFTLEFEVNFRPGDGHYGNIFRIIGNEEVNIDLVSNLASPSSNFWLVFKDQILFSYTWDDIPEAAFGKWMKIRIGVDTQREIISATLNTNHQEKKVEGIHNLQDFHIQFGICKHKSFLNSDVSPMTLNDVRVYDGEEEIYRHWKLTKHAQDKVYDEIAYVEAEVQNPNWEIDKHIHWKNRKNLQIENLLGVVKDEQHGQVYLVDDQAVFIYGIDSAKVTDTLAFLGGQPFSCQGNQMIYNPYTEEIWSYNFDNSQISTFDFQTQQWSQSEPACLEPDLWHHNRWISPLDSSLYTFGGYGHYTYKNFVRNFGVKGETPDTITLRQPIPPRYLSSAGLLNERQALIFGGYGSKSGRQELSPQFYYDLYALDIQDFSVEKLWSLETTESPFVPSEYLLADAESRSFYTLLYNSSHFETSLRLAKFDIEAPEKRFFADSVPYQFLDTNSWATFFLNKKTSELITLTTHGSEVNVYSLAYPPLFPEQVYQQEDVQQAAMMPWILLPLLLLVGVTLFFLLKAKKRNTLKSVAEPGAQTEVAIPGDHRYTEQPASPQHKHSAVYLLGGFQVFDQQGEDITADFTPTIKQLFLLILLTSLKNEKGVSSTQLKDTLWFDKSATSARNNRNVNMSKLRAIFERIGSIELRHDHTYWYTTLDAQVYCDYSHVLGLIHQSQGPESLNKQEIFQLIDIVSRGELCPGLQTEWIDNFKADFANKVTDLLSSLPYQRAEVRDDHHLLLNISECMLKFDTLSEDAIAMKCSALSHMGKKGLAKHSYDMFCKEYRQILGEDYILSFNELLSHQWSYAPDAPDARS